jgi:hypothetical protein
VGQHGALQENLASLQGLDTQRRSLQARIVAARTNLAQRHGAAEGSAAQPSQT